MSNLILPIEVVFSLSTELVIQYCILVLSSSGLNYKVIKITLVESVVAEWSITSKFGWLTNNEELSSVAKCLCPSRFFIPSDLILLLNWISSS